MKRTEIASSVVGKVVDKLQNLPELDAAIHLLMSPETESNKELFKLAKLYIQYLKIVQDLTHLNGEDIKLIRLANSRSVKLGISASSVYHGGAESFLNVIGPEKWEEIFTSVLESSVTDSEFFQSALDDLAQRMFKGRELKESGLPTSDGDPIADKAIWGHTMGLQPEAMIHFVMCHFLERTFTAYFAQDSDQNIRDLVTNKDTLLSAIGDVIKLRRAQGRGNFEIGNMWSKQRAGVVCNG